MFAACWGTKLYECGNGEFIPASWKCDNENDCGDDTDEEIPECSQEHCDAGMFYCPWLNICIPGELRCDGIDFCIHDEMCIGKLPAIVPVSLSLKGLQVFE